MRQISTIMMVVAINLLAQWSACKPNNKNTEATPHSTTAAQKSNNDECDFTVYQPVRESHFVQRAVTKKVEPIYPPDAVNRGIQGWVNVKILINRDGDVEKACAIDGDQSLKDAVEKAALQWKFKPHFGAAKATEAGSRKYMEDVITFNFDLEKK
jgi:TonB family protein